ncbi:MAG: RagB/SusD family nutrient uptake outer membrane protein [Balneola sp.]
MNIFKKSYLLLLVAGLLTAACSDFLEPSVDQAKETSTAVSTVADLQAVVYGILDDMNSTALYGRDLIVANEVRSDNMWSSSASNRFGAPSQHVYTTQNGNASSFWTNSYGAIAIANIAIAAEVGSSATIDDLKGQAYALRALLHFDLVRTFGQQHAIPGGTANLGVPYVTTYNEPDNFLPARESVADVYTKVLADLATAEGLISTSNTSKTSMSYYAVKALQSRVNLEVGNYQDAIDAADVVINSGVYTVPADQAALVAAWSTDEASNSIFELGYTATNNAGTNSIARIYQNTNYGDVELNEETYDLYDQANDFRFALVGTNANGTDTQFRLTGKYPDEINGEDNIRMIRIEEVILNKAEAQARNGAAGAVIATTLNTLANNRYTVSPYIGTADLADVLLERRLELLGEGHYFATQMRNGDDIVADEDPGGFTTLAYPDFRAAFPIPQSEMDANSSMDQNEGYNN